MKYDKVNWKELFVEGLKDAIRSDMITDIFFNDEIEWSDEFYEKYYDEETGVEYKDCCDRVWDYIDKKFIEVFGESLLYEE